MRPVTLDQYIGQRHLLGEGKPLRRAIESGTLHSMIFWGPPGTGKTTLADIAARQANAELEQISAVTSGVKEIREAIGRAEQNKQAGVRTVLFVDEVHRFNKSQQDAFLPHVESGTVTFIGATTENPSFELNNALLSRARVYRLTSLDDRDLEAVIDQALADSQRGLGEQALTFDKGVKAALTATCSGDARMALNLLEMLADMADGQVTLSMLKDVAGEKVAQFDKQGDAWYDLISAFHKSVRGSSPDGALYWYARIVSAGGDPLYVARRLLAIASEDIGNADPRAMQVALNAWDCFTRVGPAEGERAIAQAAVYLASAPKSNAVYTAWKQALRDAKETANAPVPMHLRNAPTALMEDMGHGKGYRYAHDEPNAYAAGERYLPSELGDTRYYQPVNRGLEIKIAEKLAFLAEQDAKSPQKR
ncbi:MULTISPECIES: replication-associated recombination protein A [Salinivibrio]|uniref:Replication-associated recombination protein A n=1 Tax=Salinivibrio costicola subsp. alcaliphilus TaxID=272773 RepID=A0ABX3KY95_SALCS|nr:replication-associated recombination protein A [Salinivibrio sp. AR640]OOE96054.1 recombination factor protein RarA [Salinivibrio sp. AR640]OOF35517.1 recombination factor protein RarA [Salinivibrio costicola subsp. alcaliphilus]